jgi:hypothetical protein
MSISRACWSAALAVSCIGSAAFAQQSIPLTPVRFPQVLEKLQLSAQQRSDVEAILRKHDAAFAIAWQEFTACYQQTLKAEAFLLTAIEDGFTDTQRKQAQDLRRKTTTPVSTPASDSAKAPATGDKATPTGVALTPEQIAAVGKLQEKYHIHLGPMSRDIQACHGRLLAIEMEKFIDIEKLLTPEQVKMLTEMLQSGEAARLSGLKTDEAVKN